MVSRLPPPSSKHMSDRPVRQRLQLLLPSETERATPRVRRHVVWVATIRPIAEPYPARHICQTDQSDNYCTNQTSSSAVRRRESNTSGQAAYCRVSHDTAKYRTVSSLAHLPNRLVRHRKSDTSGQEAYCRDKDVHRRRTVARRGRALATPCLTV